MFAISATIAVNPAGATPVLSRSQVWRGLVMKAENATLFVPGMSECAPIEARADGFLRRAVYNGDELFEEVRLTPEVEVRFERVGPPGGWVTNVISDGPDGLLLTFTFSVGFPGIADGSDEERIQGEEMRHTYVAAVTATLAKVRELAAAGAI